MRIVPAPKVRDFHIMQTHVEEPGKRKSILPYLDDTVPAPKELHALASCFVARWKQLHLQGQILLQTVKAEILFWKKHGYPMRKIRQVFLKLRTYQPAYIAFRTELMCS